MMTDYIEAQFPTFAKPNSVARALNIQLELKKHAEELKIILDPIDDAVKTTVITLANTANQITPTSANNPHVFDFTMASLATAAADVAAVLDVKQYTTWTVTGSPTTGNTVSLSGEQGSVVDYPVDIIPAK